MPERIRLSRKAGWRKPEGAVVVSRPSKWGNPIDWRTYRDVPRYHEDGERYQPADDTCRGWAVTDFRHDVLSAPEVYGYPTVEEIRRELAGKDLACWCPLTQRCHADVLLEIAAGAS